MKNFGKSHERKNAGANPDEIVQNVEIENLRKLCLQNSANYYILFSESCGNYNRNFIRNPRTVSIGREQARPVPGFFAGDNMRIMTQHATEHVQAARLAQDLRDQKIGILALKNSMHSSAQLLARSLEDQGIRCSWVWYPDSGKMTDGETGTAFLCLDRRIRCVDRFPIHEGGSQGKHGVQTALGIQIEGMEDWFYSLSLNPAKDHQNQWKRLNGCVAAKRLYSTVWLLGMEPCEGEIPPGSWIEAADGEIWCSRKREIRSCTNYDSGKRNPHTKGAAIIEVKE